MADALQECLSRFPKIDSLKPEQKKGVEALLAGQDVLAILPTGFRKSLIYQMFCMAKLSSNANVSVLVISPLNSIIEEQVNELNDLGLSVERKRCRLPESHFRRKVSLHFLFCRAMPIGEV